MKYIIEYGQDLEQAKYIGQVLHDLGYRDCLQRYPMNAIPEDTIKEWRQYRITPAEPDESCLASYMSPNSGRVYKFISLADFVSKYHPNYKLTNTTMFDNITAAIRGLRRQEPEKTFVKLGILNKAGELTDEGKQAYLDYLISKETTDGEFYKSCKELLDEEEQTKD